MSNKRVSEIKRAQKERFLFRELSEIFLQLNQENKQLGSVIISRIALSPDKGLCTVYFYHPEGESAFKETLEILKLYKPSIRKAIASKIAARYTPDLRFLFDDKYEKQERLDQIFEKVKAER